MYKKLLLTTTVMAVLSAPAFAQEVPEDQWTDPPATVDPFAPRVDYSDQIETLKTLPQDETAEERTERVLGLITQLYGDFQVVLYQTQMTNRLDMLTNPDNFDSRINQYMDDNNPMIGGATFDEGTSFAVAARTTSRALTDENYKTIAYQVNPSTGQVRIGIRKDAASELVGGDWSYGTSVTEAVIELSRVNFDHGFVEGLETGYKDGYNDGYGDGYHDGFADGYLLGKSS